MSSQQNEAELLTAVRRSWCPIWIPGRRHMRSRLPFDIHKLASTRGVKISYDADEAYAESLEFRKMGRHGSHAAALLYAGQRGCR